MGSGVRSTIMMSSDPQSNGAETRKPSGKGQTAAIQISPYNGAISMNDYVEVKRLQNSSSAGHLYMINQ